MISHLAALKSISNVLFHYLICLCNFILLSILFIILPIFTSTESFDILLQQMLEILTGLEGSDGTGKQCFRPMSIISSSFYFYYRFSIPEYIMDLFLKMHSLINKINNVGPSTGSYWTLPSNLCLACNQSFNQFNNYPSIPRALFLRWNLTESLLDFYIIYIERYSCIDYISYFHQN